MPGQYNVAVSAKDDYRDIGAPGASLGLPDTSPASYAIDSYSNVTGVMGPSGEVIRDLGRQNRSNLGWTFWSPTTQTVVPTITNLTNATVVQSFENINGERWIVFTCTTAAAATSSFDIAWDAGLSNPSASGSPSGVAADSATIEFQALTVDKRNISVFLGNAAGYAINTVSGNRSINGGNTADVISLEGLTSMTFHQERFDNNSKTGFTEPCRSYGRFTVAKMRIDVQQTIGVHVFKLRSFSIGTSARKARLAITLDDGPRSILQRGIPIFELYGIKTTACLIQGQLILAAQNVGGIYASVAEWKQYVDAGNACIGHGTNFGGANLYSGVLAGGATAALNAARVADMNLTRDLMLANGLCSQNGAACYAWPQGVWNATTGETSLLDAARAAGYKLCRSATAYPSGAVISYTGNPVAFQDFRAMSVNNYMRMIAPVNGHNRQATDALEAVNIAQLCNRVLPDLAASGMDGTLYFHDCVQNGTATLTTDIEMQHLEMICQTIESLRDTLDTVLFEDFISN